MQKMFKFIFIFLLGLVAASCGVHVKSEMLTSRGNYFDAERYLEEQIKDYNKAKSGDLIWLCHTYLKLKKYNKTMKCLDSLEDKISKGDKYQFGIFSLGSGLISPKDLTVMPHLMRAEAYLDLADYEKALSSALTALRLAETNDWDLVDKMDNWDRAVRIRALGLIVIAYAFLNNYDNANRYLKELEDAFVGFTRGYFVNKEKKLALKKAYIALKKFDQVIDSKKDFGDYMSILVEVFSLGTIPALKEKAFAFVELPINFINYKALYEKGYIQEAKEGYDRLLNMPQTKNNGEIYWVLLYDRAKIYKKEGDTKNAISLLDSSISILESQRSTINTEASKIGFVGDKQNVYYEMVATLYENQEYSKAYEYVERSKSRALVDLLASKKDLDISKGDGEIKVALEELNNTELETSSLDKIIKPDDTDQLKLRGIKIKDRISRKSPEISNLITVSGLSTDQIRSYLKDDETLIEYYYFDNDLYAFVLNRQELKVLRLDGKNLSDHIESFRREIMNLSSNRYDYYSELIYRKIFKPLEEFVKTKNVIIVPHGILHYLPFNALKSEKGYLAEIYSLSFLPSASVLKFLKSGGCNKNNSILIFGNPDLDDSKYDLQYASEEALEVSKEFSDSKVLTRKKATETEFKKHASAYCNIHLATHGTFDSRYPLSSGLYFARDEFNNGFLEVSELYSLNLSADLVTLSACETALGKINSGDDVIGLQRGFLYAGARSIIASLWTVDDLATSILMKQLYINLKKMNKSDSLRDAQLAVKKQYAHPFYWAGFQLTGMRD